MERIIKFIVVLPFAFSQNINAQEVLSDSFININKNIHCFPVREEKAAERNPLRLNSMSLYKLPTIGESIPANYYTSCFGFFCRKEWMLEKATKIPFRLRVGSLEYVDRMEWKVR
jgi:hypothetical protein